jgi:HAD superfamily hydrolase (TIGR01509 family)
VISSTFAGLIFDLDGTLVQSEHLHRESWVGPLAEIGVAIDDEAYIMNYAGKPGMEIIRDHIGLEGDAAKTLYDKVNEAYWLLAEHQVAPTAGLIDFLDSVADRRLAVCTSAQKVSAHRMLDILGLADRFAAVVTATDVENGKPHPEPFLLAAEQIGLAPMTCVAFEDSANGLISARTAGMFCIGIGEGQFRYRELAPVWIDDFTDRNLGDLF